jgi:hypothetical protein
MISSAVVNLIIACLNVCGSIGLVLTFRWMRRVVATTNQERAAAYSALVTITLFVGERGAAFATHWLREQDISYSVSAMGADDEDDDETPDAWIVPKPPGVH